MDEPIRIRPTKRLPFAFPKEDGEEDCRVSVELYVAYDDLNAVLVKHDRSFTRECCEELSAAIKAWTDCNCCRISQQQAVEVCQIIGDHMNAEVAERDALIEERKKKLRTSAPSPTGTAELTPGIGAT